MKVLFLALLIGLQTQFAVAQQIQRETAQSLLVVTFKDSTQLRAATGFIVKSKSRRNYLITNWHVITNKNPVSQAWLDPKAQIEANRIAIVYNGKNLGDHNAKIEKLVDAKGAKLYQQFPFGKEMVDMVAIPLTDTAQSVGLFPVNYKAQPDSAFMAPADRLFVIGFPLGYASVNAFPIWKSGLVASDPDLPQEGKPIFWIDDIGYPAMSGSPVYRKGASYFDRKGNLKTLPTGNDSFFVGMYSNIGINGLGTVWKAGYLKQFLDKLP
ncbi:S1 family peptidase [Spirosoma knui]